MPILKTSFTPILPLKNPHFNTMYRTLFMKDKANYKRTRITTWDDDFIDLDFSIVKSKSLVVLIHGLEGSSQSNYMITTSKELNLQGFDTVCMNLRGCSEEDNLLLGTYHGGKTDDVNFVVNYLAKNYNYSNIIITGFSLGGNLTLKYLGEYANRIPKEVKGAIAVSAPVDMTSSQIELDKFKNKIYLNRFLGSIRLKISKKAEKHPNFQPDRQLLLKASKFSHLENLFTVPVFGFDSPSDYWVKASSKPYIHKIKHPTLLINAKDDTFLGPDCFPTKEAKESDNFYLMMPKYGGHVGFISSFTSKNRWIEDQIINFIIKKINISS